MNFFHLVLKQMRQRALSTWLTLLSVVLGVALAIAIILFQREGGKLFGQADFGYDVLIGPKGNKLQLVLNTAYQLGQAPGTISYSYYEQFPHITSLESLTPFAVGDNYKGYRIVGTLPKIILSFPEQRKRASEFATIQDRLSPQFTTAWLQAFGLLSRQIPFDRLWPASHSSATRTQFARDLSQASAHQQELSRQVRQLAKRLDATAPDAAARLEQAAADMDRAATTLMDRSGAILTAEGVPALGFNAVRNPIDLQQSAAASLRAARSLLGTFRYRKDRAFELAQGVVFHARKFEAVIGSEVAARGGLTLGSTFKATHGSEAGPRSDEHEEAWTVVGILQPTHTANDRVIFIPLVSSYAIPAHEKALEDIAKVASTPAPATLPTTRHADHHGEGHDDHDEAYELAKDGTIELKIPKEEWRISAIAASTPSASVLAQAVCWQVDNGPVAMAVNPASEMAVFFDTFFKGSAQVLLMIALLVSIVAAVAILVSIYNSVSARRREIAILRALGATRARVLGLICVEAGLIGLLGALLGLAVGHALGAAGSVYLQRLLGEGLNWLAFGVYEWLYLALVVVLAVLAGLVPAIDAYRTPVAANLVAV